MSDDKTKRGHPDSDLFNKKESYEVAYAVNQLKREFPDKSNAVIRKALMDSAKVKQFHESRKMILVSAGLKLKHSK